MHFRGNTARKGWSWPNFWANSAPVSLATVIEQSDLYLVGSLYGDNVVVLKADVAPLSPEADGGALLRRALSLLIVLVMS